MVWMPVSISGCHLAGRHPEQGIELGKRRLESAAFAQHLEEDLGCRPQQHFFQLLPDPLWGQVGQLSSLRHHRASAPASRGPPRTLGMRNGGEAAPPAGCAGDPGQAYETWQQPALPDPARRRRDRSVRPTFGDGYVDGEIPAQQIRSQRHLGAGMATKPVYSCLRFAFRCARAIPAGFWGEEPKDRPIANHRDQHSVPHVAPTPIGDP